MSNSIAIAAVTSTLRSILELGVTAEGGLNDTTVTILPLDKARGTNSNNQLNLFLYQVARNAAWINADMPRQLHPGETGFPPLALNLYYLLTAFGRDNDVAEPFAHRLLGKAMSVLHDHPVLSAEEIKAAAPPESDLDRQLERVRVTFHPISVDELSKLWTGFATQYRLSAAYEASVALIESTRSSRTPLPVLTRGAADKGIGSQADLTPPTPTLEAIMPPHKQPAARLNDIVKLTGFRLDGTNVGVVFSHPALAVPIEVAPEAGGSGTTLSVKIPDQPADWFPGFYAVNVVVQRPGETFRRSTNQLVVALAPTITIDPPVQAPGSVTLTIASAPEIGPEQRATLLLGDRELPADPHPAQTDTLTFTTTDDLPPGDYYVRLRVDGVDSLLVDREAMPPAFDQSQKVTLT